MRASIACLPAALPWLPALAGTEPLGVGDRIEPLPHPRLLDREGTGTRDFPGVDGRLAPVASD